MTWTLWTAFAAASLLLGIVPGPGVMNIVSHALRAGKVTALAAAAGMAMGNATAMTLSLCGIGALLATSATAFAVVKWAGSLYLVGLGVAALARPAGRSAEDRPPATPKAAFLSSVAIGILHPKTIVFFTALAPQFITPGASYAQQAAILTITFCAIVLCTDAAYALAATRAAAGLRTPAARRWSSRASGTILIAAGGATAAS